jgi:hypothetical protein
MKIDGQTQLTDIQGDDNSLMYTYTLSKKVQDPEALKKALISSVTKGNCANSATLKYFFNNDISFKYKYMGVDGSRLFGFKVSKASCQSR